ncbi:MULTISPECIES: CoA pyrophosphatase [Hydrocarboniphaga]|nr:MULTISPECIES: CoA pyrophosphatase [Hydrocarboniphaga]MDZ4077292.1 CoA pyrophosphatase [Hydrocarboniphaga sp.]
MSSSLDEDEATMPRQSGEALAGEGAEFAEWEQRLRAALAGSSEQQRELYLMELPPQLDELRKPEWLAALKPAAVLVPIVAREPEPTVLLTRRSELMRNHKGQIAFPGGRRDAADVSAVDNALREADEEIGLKREHVEIIGYLDDYPTGSLYRVTPVVGVVRELPELRLDAVEVAEAFEVPLSLLLDPSNYASKTFVRDGIELPFFEVRYGEYAIWGATAGMLRNLCRKVGGA